MQIDVVHAVEYRNNSSTDSNADRPSGLIVTFGTAQLARFPYSAKVASTAGDQSANFYTGTRHITFSVLGSRLQANQH
ncbi:hypothetical protein N9153_00765 [Planctomicrobium sp.]|nr:hypothetical protein [Planctomicrobium sp.]